MYVFYWFGKAKSAFIALCITGGIAAVGVLTWIVGFFIDETIAKMGLLLAAMFGAFALIYFINWIVCRAGDKKRAAKEAAEAQAIQYQQAAAQQPIQAQPQDGIPVVSQPYQPMQGQYPQAPMPYYPVMPPQPAKLPGQGFARAGLTLSIIGALPAAFIGLVFFTSSFNYYDAADFFRDLILFAIFAVLPLLGLVFGLCAKGKKYPKGSASASVIIGGIGMAILLSMTVYSAIMAFS